MFFLTPFILAASLAALPFQAMHSFSRHSNYEHITSMSKYKQAFQGIKPVIMMLSAPWCTFCKAMEPDFDYIASLHKHNVDFYIVDTNEVKPLIDELQIKGLPTIICAKEGEVLHQERKGAMNKRELANCVHTFLAKVTSFKKPQIQKKQPIVQQPTKKIITSTPQPTKKGTPVVTKPIKKRPLVKKVTSKKLSQPKKVKIPVQKRKHKKKVQKVQPSYETVPAYFYEEGNPYPQNYLEIDSYSMVM